MKSYEDACNILQKKNVNTFSGKKKEELVQKAEIALGLKFPPSYRRFLLDFGNGNIKFNEIYGIEDDNFINSEIPNGIWLTLNLRKKADLPKQYIIIHELGDGSYDVIDKGIVDKNGESPIICIKFPFDKSNKDKIENSFGDFFLSLVNRHLNK